MSRSLLAALVAALTAIAPAAARAQDGPTLTFDKPCYRKHGKVLKAVKLGRLGGDCGDRHKTLRRGLPRGLRPGRYTLMFTTSPRGGDGERISFTQRFR